MRSLFLQYRGDPDSVGLLTVPVQMDLKALSPMNGAYALKPGSR